ncbi:MAG: hypothetical protein KDA20_12020, partial [Phycisphaerales bacterium]|nr:hypothetical protein [Phycisphaerales bacterium]
IWAHCGLLGFSTQKLTWGSAVGIPFEVGLWVGPDDKSIIAALDPGPYSTAIQGRLDTNPEWVGRVNANGKRFGIWADYHYYGVGDQGGAPRDPDVANYIDSVDNPDSQMHVALVASDQMYKDITPALRTNLPSYKGDLLLTEHSAGTLSSQAYMKRWNRKSECLADAAERASTMAWHLGAIDYPRARMERAWVRFLANQMHDILPGTSIPRAYTYSWNDEIIAQNNFAAMLTDAVAGVSRALDTNTEGVPLLIYNPLAIERTDLAEATVDFPEGAPQLVRVFGPDGSEVPSQLLERTDQSIRLLVQAHVPPVSVSVFDVRPGSPFVEPEQGPRVEGASMIENARYRVRLDEAGDVASIFDKTLQRELLTAPAQLVFTHERPKQWPAWNMDWADRQRPPIGAVDGAAQVRVLEQGPLRATVEVQRAARDSIITQRIQLARDSDILVFDTSIDWQSAEVALKASFPLTASNPLATYNWGLGTIERGNNEPVKYEVPSHEWFDLTDASGDFGVSVLEDCKYGSDKPSDSELRLTLLYTPGVRSGYLDQHSQDWGRHEMRYALYGHAGDWRKGQSEWQARRLNQPLRAFSTPKHGGSHGRSVSFAHVSTPQVDLRAIKAAESADRVIVRAQELWGQDAHGVRLALGSPIIDAFEVDGQERRIGLAKLDQGELVFDLTPYSPRAFSVRLARAEKHLTTARSTSIPLPFNRDVISTDDDRNDGSMDADGRSYPSEMLPERIVVDGVTFRTGPRETGALNAVACTGQTIRLPGEDCTHVSFLLAATEDCKATFKVDGAPETIAVQAWTGFVGQWDDRIWDRPFAEIDYRTEGRVVGFTPGFIKPAEIAWFATHRHHPERGNEAYKFAYLFKHDIAVPFDAQQITLPNDPRVVLLAASAVSSANARVRPAAPLYDTLAAHGPLALRHVYPPPPTPVFEGVEPDAQVRVDRFDTPDAITSPAPSSNDFGSTLQFRVVDPEGEWPVHWRSGVVEGTLPRLNDGLIARNDDDIERCVWHDNEGRFVATFDQPTPIPSIRTFSWHGADRAPQYFSIWGATRKDADPTFTHGAHDGWALLGVVDSRSLGQGGVHRSIVTPNPGAAYDALLFVTEDRGQGTFFMEIDLDRAGD